MPVQPTYPGVYIEEIPSGVHTIIGVATSITAFLGRTERGPANIPITLTSYGDYERTFGSLNPDYPVSYAVRDFFDNGGGQAVVARLFKDPAQAKAVEIAGIINGSAAADVNLVADAAKTQIDALPAGPLKDAATRVAAAAKTAAAKAGATGADVKRAAVDEAAKDLPGAGCATYPFNPDLSMSLQVVGPGKWGESLYATFDQRGISDDVYKRYGLKAADQGLFNVRVYDNSGGLNFGDLVKQTPLEVIPNVSVWANAAERRIDRVLESESNLLRFPVAGIQPDAAKSTFAKVTEKITAPDPTKPAAAVFSGGIDSDPLDLGTYQGGQDKKTGFYALEDVDLFNIMCVPPDSRSGDTLKDVYDSAVKYCVRRRAVLIVDPPSDWSNRVGLISDPAGKLSNDVNLTGENARNAFLYYPRVEMADPKRGGQYDVFPACGIIAGVFARTDTQRGVWKAPAGLDASLGGVFLEVNLTDRENGILNPLAINCLRAFPVSGKVVWGSRTLRGADQLADEYKYLPVRRTALFIEESLYRGTQWVVFQPNDEPLWGQIRLNVGSFMNDLFRKGAFQGARPQDAYFVRCDRTTTTQNDIDRGIVNIVVGFAPLKPAEFVIIQLQQIAGQIQV